MVALNGSSRRSDVDEAEWAQLRVAAWERWLELVTVDEKCKTADFRDPPRGPLKDWPPRGARHEEGHALCRWHQGSAANLPRQRGWAEEGSRSFGASVVATRGGQAIAAPLREYAKRLRKVRDHPETRAYAILEARLYP